MLTNDRRSALPGRPVSRRAPRFVAVLALLAGLVFAVSPTATSADPGGANPGTLRGASAAIALGDDHSCAITDDGGVKCWGDGGNGRLGQDSSDDIGSGPGQMGASLDPIALGGDAVAVTAGSAHTCAILVGGDVKC